MRKIKTMADVERVRRRNNIILGVIMIALLVGSSLGYSLMSADGDSEDVVNEGGFDFVRDGGMWKAGIVDDVFGFRYLPSEVSDVEMNVSIELGTYSGQPLYFVNPGEGVSEILGNIGRYVLRYQESCLQRDSEIRDLELGISGDDDLANLSDSDGNVSLVNGSVDEISCGGDLPVKDCSQNLIVFVQGNETRVYSEESCVFIVGDVLRGSDAFLYKLLGITK